MTVVHTHFYKILEKTTNIKFHQKPSNGSRVVSCGRTDRQTGKQTARHGEANSHASKIGEWAYKCKTNLMLLFLHFRRRTIFFQGFPGIESDSTSLCNASGFTKGRCLIKFAGYPRSDFW